MSRETAQDALMRQSAQISHAIELLQAQLNALHETDIENANWRDVAEFGHAAEAARDLTSRFEE